MPEIRIADHISYRATPLGVELAPFLKVLDGLPALVAQLPADFQTRVKEFNDLADIKLYIAPHCPHCPQTVIQVMALAAANPNIRLSVIDGTLFDDIARDDRVSATPTTILNDFARWTGPIPLKELIDTMRNGDPSLLGEGALRQMLEDGQAAQVAQMMHRSGQIFPVFLDLLIHSKWPVRLASMVAHEYLRDTDPTLAAEVISPLWFRFTSVDDTVKGDILHLFGEIGTPEAITRLESAANSDPSAKVRKTATEILAEIRL